MPDQSASNQLSFKDLPNLNPLKDAVASANQKRDELMEKFDDGDISDEEYQNQLKEIQDEITDAKSDLKLAERDHETVNNAWSSACRAYLDTMPGILQDEAMLTAFDSAVRAVTSQPAFANLSFEQMLRQAHANLEFNADALGLENVPPVANRKPAPAKKSAQKKTPEPKQERESSDLGKTPTTLADVPASEVSGVTDDGSFAALSKLQDEDPIAFEAALAKLPEDERDKFLSYDG